MAAIPRLPTKMILDLNLQGKKTYLMSLAILGAAIALKYYGIIDADTFVLLISLSGLSSGFRSAMNNPKAPTR